MDIAKYIGLFLLKNNFCYLHGLGNIELKKKPALYDGKMLHPSTYEILVTSAGAIDDNLANFIATNEQITISRATAELRDFSIQAREELKEGREVEIPFIGKLVEEYGRLIFITDPRLQFAGPSISAQRSDILMEDELPEPAPVYDEPEYRESEKAAQYPEASHRRHRKRHKEAPVEPEDVGINWKRVILAVLILISVIAGAIYGIRLFKSNDYSASEKVVSLPVVDSSMTKPKIDTSLTNPVPASTAVVDNGEARIFKIIIDNYNNRKKADKRALQMKSYGHNVEVLAKDSSSFLIIMPVRCKVSDTTQILDSLSNIFNPTGVSIYQ